MYQAKAAGRATYRLFGEHMDVEALGRHRIRNALHQAVERAEFKLHFQPQVELASGQVIGAEALLRWIHPELGSVPPAEFIPVAEESGLIVPIGEWVVNEALPSGGRLAGSRGAPPLSVAVNISAVQFARGDLEDTVRRALAASGLAPELLELELTESILIRNVDTVLATVSRLKRLGVKLSIDDFGTGYSSLTLPGSASPSTRSRSTSPSSATSPATPTAPPSCAPSCRWPRASTSRRWPRASRTPACSRTCRPSAATRARVTASRDPCPHGRFSNFSSLPRIALLSRWRQSNLLLAEARRAMPVERPLDGGVRHHARALERARRGFLRGRGCSRADTRFRIGPLCRRVPRRVCRDGRAYRRCLPR